MTLRRSSTLRRLTDAEISAGDRARATHTGTQPISTVTGLEAALDDFDTAVSVKANASALGTAADDEDMGTFTSPLIDDNVTVKAALESIAKNLGLAAGASNVATQRSETGAALVTLQDVARRILTPEDFTGTTTAALGAAIDAAAGKQILGNSAASYALTGWTAKAAAAVNIAGRGATFQGPASTVNFLRPSGSFRIADATIDRWAVSLGRSIADTGSVIRSTIENSRFTNLTSTGIAFDCPTDGLTIRNSSFASNTGGYSLLIGTNDRTLEDTWQRCRVAFNRFEGVSGNGSSASPWLVYGQDHLIIGNIVDGVSQLSAVPGAEAWGGYGKLKHSVLAFNNIKNVDGLAGGDITGQTVKGSSRAASGTSPNGYGSLAIGYTIRNIGLHGTRGTGFRAQTTEFQLAHSFIENPGLTGVAFDEPDAALQSSVANRVHFTTENTAGTLGYRFDTGGFGIRSLGDQVYGAFSGFRVSAGGGSIDASGVVIDNPLIGGGTYGVIVNTGGLGNVDGLTVTNAVMQSGTSLMLFDGGTVTNLRLLDNLCLNNSTRLVAGTLPADCHVRHVYKLRTTSNGNNFTFQTGLADNASYAIQMTVTAVQEDGADRAMYVRQGIVYRDGGGATIQGGALQTIGTDIETDSSWSAEVIVGGNNLFVLIIGDATQPVQWKVSIEMLGVGA